MLFYRGAFHESHFKKLLASCTGPLFSPSVNSLSETIRLLDYFTKHNFIH